ncbi:MAG: lamin tail domain-containing protein [Nanoarchaeota archaeon]|nr:lamin tail domain-containing protein [Nanoarchaeota archaeon]
MKKVVSIIILVILLTNISAIRINEFELNPSGADTGNEWVELYDRGDFDLGGYKLVNNDGDEIELSGSFSKYYIYTLEKQWLDNTDEKVFLYKDGELIDETDLLDDEENDDKTWQLCGKDWEFYEETKDDKNDCKKEDEEENEIELTNNVIEESSGDKETKTLPLEVQIISLSAKDIKSEKDKKSLDKSDYALYGFGGFCILLVVLFIIRKRKYKNEFE